MEQGVAPFFMSTFSSYLNIDLAQPSKIYLKYKKGLLHSHEAATNKIHDVTQLCFTHISYLISIPQGLSPGPPPPVYPLLSPVSHGEIQKAYKSPQVT